MTQPLIHVLLLLTLLCVPTLGLAKEKKPKAPEPSISERAEIRKLMVRLGRARHEAKRSEAATQLSKFGPKAEMSVPALAQALKDRDSNVACAAAFALGKVGVYSKAAVTGLMKALSGGSRPELKQAAAEGLGLIGPNAQAAIPALLKALESGEVDLRSKAARALGLIGPKAATRGVPALRKVLEDSEKGPRLAAAIALIQLGEKSPDLAKVLAGAVSRSGGAIVQTRQAACEALATLGPPAKPALSVLIAAVREAPEINKTLPYAAQRLEQHESFRRAAILALGEIGDEEARPALERAAKVSSLEEAAKAALAKLKG